MKVSVLTAVVLISAFASRCIGTMDARVRVSGTLMQSSASSPQCQLFFGLASEDPSSLQYGRDISGSFVQWLTVHPWHGPYRALVKCGDRTVLSKDIEYREFGSEPYDLGRIAT
jgi:hypothetical protein